MLGNARSYRTKDEYPNLAATPGCNFPLFSQSCPEIKLSNSNSFQFQFWKCWYTSAAPFQKGNQEPKPLTIPPQASRMTQQKWKSDESARWSAPELFITSFNYLTNRTTSLFLLHSSLIKPGRGAQGHSYTCTHLGCSAKLQSLLSLKPTAVIPTVSPSTKWLELTLVKNKPACQIIFPTNQSHSSINGTVSQQGCSRGRSCSFQISTRYYTQRFSGTCMSLSRCKQTTNSMVGQTPRSSAIGDRLHSALCMPCLPFLSEILHSDSIQWHAAQSLYLCCFFVLAAALLQTMYAVRTMRTTNPVVHSSSTAAFLALLCPRGSETAYLLCNQDRTPKSTVQ